MLGKEGFFNLSLVGEGVAALESNVPYEELIEVELDNDELKLTEILQSAGPLVWNLLWRDRRKRLWVRQSAAKDSSMCTAEPESAHEPGRTDGVTL